MRRDLFIVFVRCAITGTGPQTFDSGALNFLRHYLTVSHLK